MPRACWWTALFACCALVGARVAAQSQAAAQRHAHAGAEIACTPDPQLTEAAAELLLARVPRPSAQALSEAVRAAGSDGVGLHALFVPAGSASTAEQKWLAALRTRVDGELQCGRADNEAGRLVISLGRGAQLHAIDPDARIVRGRLSPGFSEGELVIEDGDAQLVRVGVNAESLHKGIQLAPELPLPLKIQLVARGPSGPRPVAERELAAQARPEARGDVASEAAVERAAVAADGGAQVFSHALLKLRAARGRRGLRPNRLLREAADQHAQDVCAKGRVAHEVEPGSGPDARLAKAGLDARVLGEAVARASDTDSALHALQNSPSHLYTLLDPRFTDFGVGVAKDQAQKYCYVVLLCAWPRYVGKH